MKRALFLDRDGVINMDHGYVNRQSEFEFVEGILALIRLAEEKGYLPVIVTNQSGIGRGYYDEQAFEAVTAYMLDRMREQGIAIGREQVFHCPHTPEEKCSCRKPAPGMILAAAERFDLDLPRSWMIGDKVSDIEAGARAGVGQLFLARKNRKIDWKDLHGF